LQPPEKWEGGVGFVSREMIEAHLPKPADDIMILMCGPPMMNKAMVSHLEAIGYPESQQFKF
jgi:cytochrome-b5 reductase